MDLLSTFPGMITHAIIFPHKKVYGFQEPCGHTDLPFRTSVFEVSTALYLTRFDSPVLYCSFSLVSDEYI